MERRETQLQRQREEEKNEGENKCKKKWTREWRATHLWVSMAVGYLQQVEGVPQGCLLQRQGEGQAELCRQAVRKHHAGRVQEAENHTGEVSRRSSEQNIQLLKDQRVFGTRCHSVHARRDATRVDLLSAALQGVGRRGRRGKALLGVAELFIADD